MGLVGGDIKLEDSVIYSKSEGKPTGVRIEGNNLDIVDSQIRNKSTMEVEGVKQGITIDLKGDLNITDTAITETDGSGVDRGDFIDEIGSDVLFPGKVGIIGVTEGFERPDPIAINAKEATITGGGVYSVNQVSEEKISMLSQPSKIDLKAELLQMNQGELEGVTKSVDVKYVEKTVLERSTNRVKVNQLPFEMVGSVDIYLDGERLFEGTDYTLRFNSKGQLMPVSFTDKLPKGSEVEIVIRAKNMVMPSSVSLNVTESVALEKDSNVTVGIIEMDLGSITMDDSHVKGVNSVSIQSRGQFKMVNESSVKSDFIEAGSVSLAADNVFIQGKSTLAGSNKIEIDAVDEVHITGESSVEVGWKDAPFIPLSWGWVDILWDSEKGQVVATNNDSPKGIFKDKASVMKAMRSWYGDSSTINIIDVNQPLDHAIIPHISIKSNSTSVDHGALTGDSGGVKSAIRIDSHDAIRFSGETTIHQFDQVELNAGSVEVLQGVEFQSKLNEQDMPSGYFIVNSQESASLSGATILGSLVVNSDGDITVTDMNMGEGGTKVRSYVLKLDAGGNVYFGVGDLGVLSSVWTRMLNVKGSDIQIKRAGLRSQSGVSIIGSNIIELKGPANIEASELTGAQEVAMEAPEIYIEDEVSIWANVWPSGGISGKIKITGSEVLSMSDSHVGLSNKELWGSPMISLDGGQITLDDSTVTQMDYYNYISKYGEIYSENPTRLSGNKTTVINATESFELTNKSRLYMNVGELIVNAKDISVLNSEILNKSHWPTGGLEVGRVGLNAEKSIKLTDADISFTTISSAARAVIALKGESLESINTQISIYDERKGEAGSIQLDFDESIEMDNSQVISIGASHLTRDTNGNEISIKSGRLLMENSLISGFVEGDGEKGLTRLDISGNISLDGSFIGGLAEPLEAVEFDELITDGTLGEIKNLGKSSEVVIPSELGEIYGENLYHSFDAINIGSGQTVVLEVPDQVNNVFLRITGGEATELNGEIVSSNQGSEITLINENGFVVGPDVVFEKFSGIRLAALDKLYFKDGSSFSSTGFEGEQLGKGQANYDIQTEQLTGNIKLMGAVLKDFREIEDSFRGAAAQSAAKIEKLAQEIGLPLDPTFVKAKNTLNPGDIEESLESSDEFFSLPNRVLRSLGFSNSAIVKISEIDKERQNLRTLIAEKGDAPGERLLTSNISLFGNELEMVSSGVSTILGADINLIAHKINMGQSSRLHALSPFEGEGGKINIKTGEFHLKGGSINTSSVDGPGGDIFIDSNNILLELASIEASNYYGKGVENFKTGNISINAKESFVGYNPWIIINSYTPGGAGDLSINTGELIGDGLGSAANTEFWIMAYKGNTGQLEINADMFDAKQVRIINAALADTAKLTNEEKQVYGDITINAADMNLENFTLFTGTRRNQRDSTIGDVSISAENDITIGGFLWIDHFQDSAQGMGGDIVFSARNILNRLDPEKVDPTYYPTIKGTGSISFLAEEHLELGRIKFSGNNNNPKRNLVNTLKGENISLGMDLGDEVVGADNVIFEYPDNQLMDHRVVIEGIGDVQFVSGVNLTTPGLTLVAGNLDINNSKITMGATFGSEIDVMGEVKLRGGSTIESLSPYFNQAPEPVSIDISSGHLILESGSHIGAWNHEDDTAGSKAIANLNIRSQMISMGDAFIGTGSGNLAKAGDLKVEAASISLSNNSVLGSNSYSRAESGAVTIDSNRISMTGESAIESGLDPRTLDWGLNPFAPGDAGDITITSDILHLHAGSNIRNAQIDTTLPGDVVIMSDEIKLAGGSFIATESVPLYQSDFRNRTEVDQNGSVSIKTKSLDLSESSYVKTTTVIPKRNAGDIIIEADAVSLSGRSSMLSNTEPNKFETELGLTGLDYGNAGRLEIKTDSLQLADQSKISSDSFTSGDGGDVTLTATDLALANRSAIYAGALSQGEGGRITIDTAAMNLSGKSAVVADVRDSGNGGEVSVKAAALDMDESLIYGSTSGEGVGSRISVDTDSITLKHGARIESAASAGGAAGELVVQSGIVTITGTGEGFDPKDIEGGETGERVASGLLTSTEGSGDAGTIELKADQLEMQQGLIGSASTGEGAAGSVMLRLARGLSLGQGASVSVSSSQADGGDIEIESAGEMRFVRSELTASAAKDGGSIRLLGAGSTYIRDSRMSAEAGQDGGNITISKPDLLFMNRGQLSANAVRGHGGYIQVVAEAFLPSIDTAITASSEYGVQGVVEIDTVETDIGSGLVVLPEQLEDSSVNLAERCALRLQGDVSSFFLNGQGGIPVWSSVNYVPSVFLGDEDREE